MSADACLSRCAATTQGLDRDMFTLMWGPTVAAVSVVLDHADNPVIVATALTGLMHAARIAAYHHVDEVRPRWQQRCVGRSSARPAYFCRA